MPRQLRDWSECPFASTCPTQRRHRPALINSEIRLNREPSRHFLCLLHATTFSTSSAHPASGQLSRRTTSDFRISSQTGVIPTSLAREGRSGISFRAKPLGGELQRQVRDENGPATRQRVPHQSGGRQFTYHRRGLEEVRSYYNDSHYCKRDELPSNESSAANEDSFSRRVS